MEIAAVVVPKSPEMNVIELENFIQSGMKLIIDGKYQESIKYFRNNDVAQKVGYYISIEAQVIFSDDEAITDEDVFRASNGVASRSSFDPGSGAIRLGGIASNNPGNIPESLWHNVALVHAEEWLHGFQEKKHGPLLQNLDGEIDVAEYLIKNGVPVTDEFMARYDRGLALGNGSGRDDSGDETPALRRGIFLNVRRSDGTLENDWQIAGFDHKSGDIVAVNFATENEKAVKNQKKISMSEYVENNQTGIHPFEKAGSFGELFNMVSQKIKIVTPGLNGQGQIEVREYTSKKVVYIINQVRKGILTVDYVPRSGGLRNKVLELLKKNS